MQNDQWTMTANSCHKFYFALSRLTQTFQEVVKQMMPKPLHAHPSLSGFYTKYAAFLIFNFQQEEVTGFHNANVFSFIFIFISILQPSQCKRAGLSRV